MTTDSTSSTRNSKYDLYPAVFNKIAGIQNQTFIQHSAYDHACKGERGADDFDAASEWDRLAISAITVMCLAADLYELAKTHSSQVSA